MELVSVGKQTQLIICWFNRLKTFSKSLKQRNKFDGFFHNYLPRKKYRPTVELQLHGQKKSLAIPPSQFKGLMLNEKK